MEKHGIESEIVWIGVKAVQGCITCYQCVSKGQCAFNDALYQTVRERLKESDALIVGSPTYYGGPNGSLCTLLDRLFFSCKQDLVNKVWSSVAVCRRGGASTTFHRDFEFLSVSTTPQQIEECSVKDLESITDRCIFIFNNQISS